VGRWKRLRGRLFSNTSGRGEIIQKIATKIKVKELKKLPSVHRKIHARNLLTGGWGLVSGCVRKGEKNEGV